MMQKDLIIQKLREQGCRITKQRLMLLDIILEEDCSCCKEIYYKASKLDKQIGSATVYRMINTLEEIGAISRKNMYRISYESPEAEESKKICTVELDDGSKMEFSEQTMRKIIQSGMKAYGYLDGHQVKSFTQMTRLAGGAM